jgi:chromosome segregation ATPase
VRTLSASLRLPSNNLDAGMVELRKLGKVREESQNSSDVTSQYVDLQARLSNARNTEQRLVALQRQRTDKLADVVNVEREISRVREEIERMVAQQKEMTNQVQYATVQLSLTEEYRAEVQPVAPSPGSQLRNASIDGYRGALDSLLAVALFVLRYAPTLLLWSAVLAPVVLLARRYFHSIRLS